MWQLTFRQGFALSYTPAFTRVFPQGYTQFVEK